MNGSCRFRVAGPEGVPAPAAMIRAQISGGALQRGQPVPSITRLSQEQGHARQTCSKAYRMLEREGLVARFLGLGYFVA
jgi:DNA-binding transcriptional regulator YhcF (GntR family)